MGIFDSIEQLPPSPAIRPRTQRLPHRKPREDRPDPRNKRPAQRRKDDPQDERPHIDEYA